MVGYCLRIGSLDESNLAEASFVFLPVCLNDCIHTHIQACKLIDESSFNNKCCDNNARCTRYKYICKK